MLNLMKTRNKSSCLVMVILVNPWKRTEKIEKERCIQCFSRSNDNVLTCWPVNATQNSGLDEINLFNNAQPNELQETNIQV